MSTNQKIPLPMIDYSQPDEYHFSQDSILLAKIVAEKMGTQINTQTQALDLCTGCGVVGLELALLCPQLTKCDFLDIQEIFKPHFEKNLKITAQNHKNFKWLAGNYEMLQDPQHSDKYDLIISNPPFFFLDDGLHPPSEVKKRCHFFVDSTLEDLFLGILNSLKPQGQAFVLVKEGKGHGRNNLRKIRHLLTDKAQEFVYSDIRGTLLIHVTKNRID